MSLVQKRGIAPNAVDETKIQLSSNANFNSLNNAGTAPVALFKSNASDKMQILTPLVLPNATVAGEATSLGQVQGLLGSYVLSSLIGAPNGVAALDGTGKVPANQLPASVLGSLSYKGTFDVAAAAGAYPASPAKGDYYVASTAGTLTFAAVPHTYSIGDWLAYDGTTWDYVDNSVKVSSVFGRMGVIVAANGDYNTSQVTESTNLYYTQARFDSAFAAKSTTNLSEGTNLYYTQARFDSAFAAKSTTNLVEGTNLYFTNARSIASVLTGFTAGAGVVSATDSILSALQKHDGNISAKANSFIRTKESHTVLAAEVTSKSITLLHPPLAASMVLQVFGVVHVETVDYTISGSTLSFVNGGDLYNSIIAGDIIQLQYQY